METEFLKYSCIPETRPIVGHLTDIQKVYSCYSLRKSENYPEFKNNEKVIVELKVKVPKKYLNMIYV